MPSQAALNIQPNTALSTIPSLAYFRYNSLPIYDPENIAVKTRHKLSFSGYEKQLKANLNNDETKFIYQGRTS